MTYLQNRDFLIEVKKGNVSGHSLVQKFGQNPDVDSGTTPEAIWTVGGTYNWLTTAQTLDVVSTSTADDADPAGTGAQTVTIQGLDSSWNEQTETIDMNGTGGTTTSNTWIRVYRMWVATAGSGGGNAGSITADGTTSGVTHAEIDQSSPAGKDGQTLMAIYTIPNGKTGYVLNWYVSQIRAAGAVGAEMILWQRPNADTSTYANRKLHTMGAHSYSGLNMHEFEAHPKLNAKTDIWVEAQYASTTNLNISAGFDILLVDN